ncbi:MAG TPA: hypothetical protein DCE78_08975 [Bacteroidetes bacterium]|nr:hypothetical protein [Bacteroidota bacterium]
MSGKSFFDVTSNVKSTKLIYDVRTAFSGDEGSGEIEIADIKGNNLWFQYHITPVLGRHNKVQLLSIGMLDITEAKNYALKLNSAERLLHSVFDSSTTGICITDTNGIFVDVNSEYCKIYGYSREELIGQPFTKVVPTENQQLLQDLHDAFISGNEELDAEWTVQRKDGQFIDIYASAMLLEYSDGSRFKVTSVRDISENKKYHNLLTETQSKAHVGGWEFDVYTRELTWTEEVYNIFEISDSAKLSLDIMNEFFVDEAGLVLDQAINNSLEKGSVFDLELTAKTSANRTIWTRITCKPIVVHKKTIKLFGTIQDITLKKFNQQLMNASEQKYRAAFQNSMLGFFVTNPDGRIEDANIAACEMFGYTVEEFRELGRGGIIDPNTPHLEQMLKERLETGKASGELICIRKNGQRFHVEFTSAIYENDEGELNTTTIMHDISNRKTREHHLKLLESVLTNTQDAVLITEAEPLDEPGPRIIFVNEAFTKMTGYTSDEVLGKNPRILQGPKTDQKLLREFGEKLRRWETCELETINYKKNGEEFWINIKATPVANEDGWYTHWFAIERDVTERKNREIYRKLINDINQVMNSSFMLKDSLRGVLELFKPVLDFDLCEIWTVNMDKKIINMVAKYANNPEGERFYEMTKDNIVMKVGQGLPGTIWKKKERIHWNKIGSRKLYLRNKAASEIGLNTFLGYPLIHNNEVVATLLFGLREEHVHVENFDALIQPVCDQLSAEIRRKQLDEEIEMIFNFAPDIICVAGMDGYYKKVNPAMSQILGYSESELLTQPIKNFVHPDDIKITGKEIKGIKKGEGKSFFENRYIEKMAIQSGCHGQLQFSMKRGLIYSVAKNITDKKEADQRLNKLNDELESRAKALADSNAELEQFAYVASHDLQEPLRMISSFLSQIEKKYNDKLDDKGRQYIHFAVDGAQRMRSIILDLLEYSRVGRVETEYSDFNLGEVVNEVIQLYKAQLSETQGKISYSKLPEIRAIRVPIRQLLQNLIGNALKFRAKDRPPEIQISAKELKSFWEIKVKDNGIGISPDYSDRVFIIFQRLHTKQEYEGSGMGLAICKKIIEKHGGKIWVESNPGKGSTFHFTIKK